MVDKTVDKPPFRSCVRHEQEYSTGEAHSVANTRFLLVFREVFLSQKPVNIAQLSAKAQRSSVKACQGYL